MRIALVLIAFSFTVGCGQQIKNSSKFSKAEAGCEGNVAKGRYLVTWKDGRMTLERAESDESFVKDFVDPHSDEIQFAENDFRVHLDDVAENNVSAMAQSSNNWGPIQVRVDTLWQQNVRGAGITVAVIDTGADVTHPQLMNRILTNPGEAGMLSNNGVDDDHNGYVDDYYGYDWVHERGLTGDNQYHGTHVSGIIAADHSDMTASAGSHAEGLAPQAKILPLAFLDSEGGGNIDSAVRAIDYAVARGARVINASWGGSMCSRSLMNKVASLNSKGVMFVAAAGNSSSDIDRYREFPASFNLYAQMTVGSSTQFDTMADHSNYGAHNVHIFAPGAQIVSTVPGGGLASLTGTSMAAPFVTGAIALLMGAEPTAQAHQIRQALYDSAVHSDDYINVSKGRLDLASALNTLRAILNQ